MKRVVLAPAVEIAMRTLDPDGEPPGTRLVQLPGTLGHRRNPWPSFLTCLWLID